MTKPRNEPCEPLERLRRNSSVYPWRTPWQIRRIPALARTSCRGSPHIYVEFRVQIVKLLTTQTSATRYFLLSAHKLFQPPLFPQKHGGREIGFTFSHLRFPPSSPCISS